MADRSCHDRQQHKLKRSANDGHIYVAPVGGGTATRVTHAGGGWFDYLRRRLRTAGLFRNGAS